MKCSSRSSIATSSNQRILQCKIGGAVFSFSKGSMNQARPTRLGERKCTEFSVETLFNRASELYAES
jgi:hypothetical protein